MPDARDRELEADQAIELARHQLAALAGAGPDRGLAIRRPALTPIDARLPSTLPADLVDAAPTSRRSACASKPPGAASTARKRRYPDVDLTAFVGLQALDFPTFLRQAA